MLGQLSRVDGAEQRPYHPSVPPDAPEGWQRDQELKETLDASQAALEEGGPAAGHLFRPSSRGFFSAGKGRYAASHMPVETAQCRANAMTRSRRARRSGCRIRLSSRPKPRLLKSENIASIPHLRP